jgi:hypothetical protein
MSSCWSALRRIGGFFFRERLRELLRDPLREVRLREVLRLRELVVDLRADFRFVIELWQSSRHEGANTT